MSIEKLRKILDKTSVLFLSTNQDNPKTPNICFYDPVEIITTQNHKDLKDKLIGLEEKIDQNHFIAGYLSYEAGYCFEEKFVSDNSPDIPLVWFGVFSKKIELKETSEEILIWMQKYAKKNTFAKNRQKDFSEKYTANVRKIKDYIAKGDIYQANYTFSINFELKNDAFALFCDLYRKQPVGYSAYINDGSRRIISLSPELFFQRDNDFITVKPMKGTIKRGKTLKEDKIQSEKLKSASKDRAENLMIVDLLRNDLGRICEVGSVKTKSLFDIKKYKTLFQMTSTVTGILRRKLSWFDIFRNIFPSGSVTGAPKIRAMEIIKELEKKPRGIYTGSIGYIMPQKAMFNVAIRTIVTDESTGKAVLGIGSGIVADSDPDSEFAECNLKSDFLFKTYSKISLIETILWENGDFFLLDSHLRRLSESASYFDFPLDGSTLNQKLQALSKTFQSSVKYKVRILLSVTGKFSIESIVIDEKSSSEKNKFCFSDQKVSTDTPYLYHKTTNRDIYNSKLKWCREKGCYDLVFMNEKNQVTEGAISNIFIKKGDFLYTPPVECGLLPGVYRQYLIKNSSNIFEKIIYKDDILSSDEVYFDNSVSKKVKVYHN